MLKSSELHNNGFIRATHPTSDRPRLSDNRRFDKYVVSMCLTCDHEHCSGSAKQFRKCMNKGGRT